MSCACSEVACAIASVTGHRNITSPSMLRHLNACQKIVVPLISPPLSLHCPVEHQEKVVCGAACRQGTAHGCPSDCTNESSEPGQPPPHHEHHRHCSRQEAHL